MDLSTPVVMGIVNATPDSFFSPSRVRTEHEVCAKVDQMVDEGAAIIDVGAFSTRPGAAEVSAEEEMSRLRVALTAIRHTHPDIVLSVDTFRPDVARMAVEEFGVAIINDVSEGGITGVTGIPRPERRGDVPEMFAMVAHLHAAYVLMSVKPSIDSMLKSFSEEVAMLRGLGVADIIIDPGFGFGKDLADNYRVMAHLDRLSILGLPILVGVSRKSMLTRLLDCDASSALNATTALHTAALLHGASILRVHDVREAVEACRVVEALRKAGADHPGVTPQA